MESGARRGSRDRSTVIAGAIGSMARWSLRLLLIAAAVYLLGYLVGILWPVLLPLFLALILASMLAPAVEWLVSRGVGRTLAAAGVMLAFIIGLIGTSILLTRSVVGQVGDVADEATGGLLRVRDWVTGPPFELSETQVDNAIDAVSSRLQDAASSIASGVFTTVGAVGSALVTGVLVLLLTFFFVKDGPRFVPWVRGLAGQRAGRHLGEVFGRWWDVLGAYIRTQLIVAFVDAILIGVGLLLLGVPLAATLAALTFFGGFIPIVGAFVAGGLSILVALVTEGPTTALLVLGLVVLVQQIEGNVLSPWLQGRSLQLHAGVVLLAVTGGGSQFGIIGAFLAVPVVACGAVLMRYLSEQVDEAAEPAKPLSADRDRPDSSATDGAGVPAGDAEPTGGPEPRPAS